MLNINKNRSCCFEKINELDKPLARLIKKKRVEKIQNKKIRNEEVITDNTKIERIKREYYEQIYISKMDNLEKMVKFLEKYNLLRLKQEEKENRNRPITSTEIETVIKNLPANNSLGPNGLKGKK